MNKIRRGLFRLTYFSYPFSSFSLIRDESKLIS
jgi:hypothetical protein